MPVLETIAVTFPYCLAASKGRKLDSRHQSGGSERPISCSTSVALLWTRVDDRHRRSGLPAVYNVPRVRHVTSGGPTHTVRSGIREMGGGHHEKARMGCKSQCSTG